MMKDAMLDKIFVKEGKLIMAMIHVKGDTFVGSGI